MKAIVYSSTGGSEVLEFVARPVPVLKPVLELELGAGEVRIRVVISG
jgi:NADPH:quinone reductase-like Zn-dependent oxidoreductase